MDWHTIIKGTHSMFRELINAKFYITQNNYRESKRILILEGIIIQRLKIMMEP